MENKNLTNQIQEGISQARINQATPGYGLVMYYDAHDNTATVLMAQPGSDRPGEFYTGVPCPSYLGIQSVAPEQGRPCWVEFRDGMQSSPIITHFFHRPTDEEENLEYASQFIAENHIPRFMLEM